MSSLDSNTYNRQAWESSDFPILCETCLGDNPYVRMTKLPAGGQCKICSRPFTVFRWCPGTNARFKKTQICQTCCKIKNVCQTCIFDLQYGLPTQVRDSMSGNTAVVPSSDVNKEYFTQNMERQLANTDGTVAAFGLGQSSGSDTLQRVARTTPYYKRNRAHICSFWVKGECKRGEECPYRHEMPTDPNDPLAKQNIKDRYYGVNDPVAEKIMRRAAESSSQIEPPEDQSITTLFVGQLTPTISEQDLRDHFYQYGEIRTVHMVPRHSTAFVEFTTRAAAEEAVRRTFNQLKLKGQALRIAWGRARGAAASAAAMPAVLPVPGLPGALPVPAIPSWSYGQDTSVPPPPPPATAASSEVPPPPPGPASGTSSDTAGTPSTAPAGQSGATQTQPTPAAVAYAAAAAMVSQAPQMPYAYGYNYGYNYGGYTGMPYAGFSSAPPTASRPPAKAPTAGGGVYYPSMDPNRMGTGKNARQ